MCHTQPLYTNNKLTLAEGFTRPPHADKKYHILPIAVGTDPNLALKTRRGTGYYKVPGGRQSGQRPEIHRAGDRGG